jgi:hypothetical protein
MTVIGQSATEQGARSSYASYRSSEAVCRGYRCGLTAGGDGPTDRPTDRPVTVKRFSLSIVGEYSSDTHSASGVRNLHSIAVVWRREQNRNRRVQSSPSPKMHRQYAHGRRSLSSGGRMLRQLSARMHGDGGGAAVDPAYMVCRR